MIVYYALDKLEPEAQATAWAAGHAAKRLEDASPVSGWDATPIVLDEYPVPGSAWLASYEDMEGDAVASVPAGVIDEITQHRADLLRVRQHNREAAHYYPRAGVMDGELVEQACYQPL